MTTHSFKLEAKHLTQIKTNIKQNVTTCTHIHTHAHTHIHTPTFGVDRSVMVIVVGNGLSDTSSNPGRDLLHFTLH